MSAATTLRSVGAAAGLQARLMRRQPDSAAPLLVTPLYALVLFGFLRYAGQPSLGPNVLAARRSRCGVSIQPLP